MILFIVGILGNSHPTLQTGWYYIQDTSTCLRVLDKSNERYYIDPTPIVTIKHFAKVDMREGTYNGAAYAYIDIRFDSLGTVAWRVATDRTVGKRLALIIDDKLVYTPLVNGPIFSGVSALNRGNYLKDELEKFAGVMRSEM